MRLLKRILASVGFHFMREEFVAFVPEFIYMNQNESILEIEDVASCSDEMASFSKYSQAVDPHRRFPMTFGFRVNHCN